MDGRVVAPERVAFAIVPDYFAVMQTRVAPFGICLLALANACGSHSSAVPTTLAETIPPQTPKASNPDDLGDCALSQQRTVEWRGRSAFEACKVRYRVPCEEKCRRGEAQSCSDLAYMYVAGIGGARDEKTGLRLYTQACDMGDAWACDGAGRLFLSGEQRNASRAAQLFKRACDLGDVCTCAESGILYVSGTFPRNVRRASELLERSCDDGCKSGCGYGNSLYGGTFDYGVPADHARAVRFLERGCRLGDERACADYGLHLARGSGIAMNRACGVAFLRRGCAGSEEWACKYLREYSEKP